jgi:hypothetical protein
MDVLPDNVANDYFLRIIRKIIPHDVFLSGFLPYGYLDTDRGTAAEPGGYFQISADAMNPFPHPDQTDARLQKPIREVCQAC